jgi:hypothetical protein
MRPGDGGEEALGEWLGWQKGQQFDVEANKTGHFLVQREKSRL